MLSGGNGNLAVAVRLMRLAQFIQSDLASIPVSARSGVFSEEISERFQILAESEGFKVFSEISSEGLPSFFGNADVVMMGLIPRNCFEHERACALVTQATPVTPVKPADACERTSAGFGAGTSLEIFTQLHASAKTED